MDRKTAPSLYGRARDFARRHRGLYAMVRTIKYGPFMGIRNQRQRFTLLEQARANNWRVLYLGSGGRRQPGMINLDITPVTGPDVVGDGYRLPFRDGTFDAIFCDYVIEHVPDPEAFLRAAGRALKQAGVFYLEIPFLQPVHGEPSDYSRWTRAGIEAMAARGGLQVHAIGLHMGPAFTMFWLLKEWIALLLSFGIGSVRAVLAYILGWLLAPLLILDLLMLHLPGADELANGYYVVASPRSPDDAAGPGARPFKDRAS